ncbi:hypothetical protein DRP07_00660 [Archaeoglobales archaeon]|nr:MAG: hypothetical protein DRP07_00660 [Archaeoglobales archaeon]
MRVYEEKIPQLIRPFHENFSAQTETLVSEKYISYFRLVDQLVSMSMAAMTKREKENLRKVNKIRREYIKHLIKQYDSNLDDEFKRIRDTIINYNLNNVILRICNFALSKKLMKDMVPKDADNYDFEEDLRDTLDEIAFQLESVGVEPLKIEVGEEDG